MRKNKGSVYGCAPLSAIKGILLLTVVMNIAFYHVAMIIEGREVYLAGLGTST